MYYAQLYIELVLFSVIYMIYSYYDINNTMDITDIYGIITTITMEKMGICDDIP